jgi:hypothetical protein
MVFKTCRKCGKRNPRFFTRCVFCSGYLMDTPVIDEKIPAYLKIGLVLCVSVILIVFVIVPGIQYSLLFVQNFSDALSGKPVAGSLPVPEYPLNRPVQYNGLKITVVSARDGQNTYNSNKFFMVTVQLENIQAGENIQVSSSNFELIDSKGTKYFPYGIGSQVTYDLSPHQGISTGLIFVIPQKDTAKKIQFQFPGPFALTTNRDLVRFIL